VAEVSFDYLQHLVTVPASVNGIEGRFVLDSGIGLTLLRSELAESAGVRPTGASFTGRRMSGQSVTIPLGEVPHMTFAGSTCEQVEVGIFDMSPFPDDFAGIGGFLSLAFFPDSPLTVDYRRGVVLVETRETLAARYAEGVPVSVDVQRDGPSVTMFMPLTIPGGRSISVEIYMGSDELILDERLADETGACLETREGGAPRALTRRVTRIHVGSPACQAAFTRRLHRTSPRTTRRSCSSGSSTTASSATPAATRGHVRCRGRSDRAQLEA
jgi:Aspartyl protease